MAENTQNNIESQSSKATQQVLFNPAYDYRNIQVNTGEDTIDSADFEKLNNLPLSPTTPIINSLSNWLLFDFPNYGVEDYINDRSKWVKGIRSLGDEPGWFYFKVFFKFNTNFGLFGGALNKDTIMQSTCALRYLNTVKTLYKVEQIPMRINSLYKFISILSQINSKYPWLIRGISNLEKVMDVNTENFSEEKSFELLFNTESTDMKIINMLNYYKLACFDDINCKEIIPENLRKFDMMVVFYHIPIKYFQTAIMVSPKRDITTGMLKPGTKLAKAEEIINKCYNFLTTKSTYYKYKRMQPDEGDFSNMMSFNMLTFHNCEFDTKSFGKYYSSEMKNDTAFQFDNMSLKINYERVYYHTMNEWTQTLFGSDGFYYDPAFLNGSGYSDEIVESIRQRNDNGPILPNTENFANRLKSLKEARNSVTFFDKNAEQYKSLIEYSESLITDGLMSMSMKNYYAFMDGNIFGSGIGSDSKYFKAKQENLKEGTVKGNLFGKPEITEEYFKTKIRMLKNGSLTGNMFGNAFDANSETDYFSKKIQLLKTGAITGNIFGNIEDSSANDKDYFSLKLSALKSGTISGNIYGSGEILNNDNDDTKRNDLLGANWKIDSIVTEIEKAKGELTSTLVKLPGAEEIDALKQSLDPTMHIDAAQKTKLDELRQKLVPSIDIDQSKKQKTNILNYMKDSAGWSKLSGKNDGLFSKVKNTANDIASFWKW